MAGEPVDVIVRLDVDAVPLAPLEIVGRAAPLHTNVQLSAFLKRAQQNCGGTFIMPEEIDTRNPTHVSQLIATIPSFLVASGRLVNERSNCAPMVYLDGRRLVQLQPAPGWGAGVDPVDAYEAVNFVIPSELAGIEVYAGAATVPPEFSGSTAACGVIVMWTQRGPGR
jgi:hypothetical protein